MEWISVKERTPEIGQIVLAWMSKRKEPVVVKFDKDSHGPLYIELVPIDIHCDREDLISHWLPITPPPVLLLLEYR